MLCMEHGQNRNLPVCVCVCVCPSHFLSTRLQVRPLNGFWQLIAKTTQIYARMCFWGSRWWTITFMGPKYPKTPHFGGLNKHFKKNMRTTQIAVSSDLCIRLTWNLTGSCGQQQRLRELSRMVVKQFQDGRRLPFWKSIYRHISVKKNHPFLMTPSSTERISCYSW